MVKNYIIGKKTASIKIPPSREYFYYAKQTIVNKTTCSLLTEVKMQSFMTKSFFSKTFLAFELHRYYLLKK